MNKLGRDFLKKTCYQFMGKSAQEKGVKQPPLELSYNKQNKIVPLPGPDSITINDIDLRNCIEQRRSVRSYSQETISLKELSFLLWITQGVRDIIKEKATFRNVPSAGARHAFETFLLINRVTNLKPGLYRYLALEHKLVEFNTESDISEKVTTGCQGQNFVKNSAVTFIWVAIAERMNWRYGERGYRYLFLDAGHVCQNLYLGSAAINCGTCAIGAYSDEYLNKLLDLDGYNHFVIYLATVGKLS